MTRDGGQFMKAIFTLTAFVFLLASGGCGYKDKPVPPYKLIPKPVSDLRCQLDEKGATLNWSYPNKTVTNEDVTDIVKFEVYWAAVAVDSYCPTCPIPFVEPIFLPGGVLPPGGNKTATYQVTVL